MRVKSTDEVPVAGRARALTIRPSGCPATHSRGIGAVDLSAIAANRASSSGWASGVAPVSHGKTRG